MPKDAEVTSHRTRPVPARTAAGAARRESNWGSSMTRVEISRSSLFALLHTLKGIWIHRTGWQARTLPRRAAPAGLAQRASAAAECAGRVLSGGLCACADRYAGAGAAFPRWRAAGGAGGRHGTQVRSVFPAARRFKAESAAALALRAEPPEEIAQARLRADGWGKKAWNWRSPSAAMGKTPSAALLLEPRPPSAGARERFAGYLPVLREAAARLSYRLGAHPLRPLAAACGRVAHSTAGAGCRADERLPLRAMDSAPGLR